MIDRDRALDALEVFVGEWRMTSRFGDESPVGGGRWAVGGEAGVVFD